MKQIRMLTTIISLFSFSTLVNALDKEQLDQLTELMVTGCSLGQRVELAVEGDGSLSFLKKGLRGEFKASRSEIPSIIDFLLSDESRIQEAGVTRKCMQRYMDRIFDAVLQDKSPRQTSGNVKRYGRAVSFSAMTMDLQTKLHELGYREVNADGYLDDATIDAIRDFQSKNGLRANGILNEETRKLLGLPAGLNASISGLQVKSAKIVKSEKPIECGVSSDVALKLEYEYTIDWQFSDFQGDVPNFVLRMNLVGNNGAYRIDQEEAIAPSIKGYIPEPGKAISGKQSQKRDFTLTAKATCTTRTTQGSTVQTIAIPSTGQYQLAFVIQNKRFSTSFEAE